VNPDSITIRQAAVEDLTAISKLAGVIWRESYPGIISNDQIEYMLARMYDVHVMMREITSEGVRYDVLVDRGVDVGFAAYGPAPRSGEAKLHKLYLRKDRQGRGLGSMLLRHVIEDARKAGYSTITLNVNKGNERAISTYRRNGFVIREAVVIDIGGGFVMDDYVMERPILVEE
jgi:ribosomal protein S18 acetylase RimI-like enzyme